MEKESKDYSSRVSATVLLAISFFVLFVDQAAKFFAIRHLSSAGSVEVIKGIFHLTLVYNRGAAFGLFQGGTFFLVLVSLVCMFVITLLFKNEKLFFQIFSLDPHDKTVRFALALIMGGAAGNLIDRLRFFAVVDFLDFRVWPVFNFADSAITIGSVLICIRYLKTKRKES